MTTEDAWRTAQAILTDMEEADRPAPAHKVRRWAKRLAQALAVIDDAIEAQASRQP